jgi:putative ABC transport system permease protein
VVLGVNFAKRFGFDVGDRVQFLSMTSSMGMNAMSFDVCGIMEIGAPMFDDKMALVPVEAARKFLKMDGVVEYLVILDDVRRSIPVAKKLNALFREAGDEELLAVPWEEQEGLGKMMSGMTGAMGFYYFIFLLMAGFVIMNTIMMVIFERTKEIGTIGALGMRRWKIVVMFVLEGMVLAAIGSLAGVLAGAAIAAAFKITGIPVGKAFEGGGLGLPMSDVIYPVLAVRNFVGALLFGVLVTTFIATFPSRRAARIEPSEAMRRT